MAGSLVQELLQSEVFGLYYNKIKLYLSHPFPPPSPNLLVHVVVVVDFGCRLRSIEHRLVPVSNRRLIYYHGSRERDEASPRCRNDVRVL